MRFFILVLLFIQCNLLIAQNNSVKEIIYRMLNANKNLRTAKFEMYTEERLLNGKFAINDRLVKYTEKPRMAYLYVLSPQKGSEILWLRDSKDSRMLINPA